MQAGPTKKDVCSNLGGGGWPPTHQGKNQWREKPCGTKPLTLEKPKLAKTCSLQQVKILFSAIQCSFDPSWLLVQFYQAAF